MRHLALFVSVLVLSSCQSGPVSDQPTTQVPTTTSIPASTLPAPSTTTTVPEPGEDSAIYLFFEGYPVAPGPYLAAVWRPGIDDLADALTALLKGVTDDEATMGLSTTIPEGTELLGVDVSEGVAHVDLSRAFESGGGSLSMMGRVAQIVYTATHFEGVDSVRFRLEGTPVEVLGGEGLIIDEPQTRSAWTELIPPILLEGPPWGSTVGTQIDIEGEAQLDSGTVSYVIVDADGIIIHEGETTTSPGERDHFAAGVALEEIPHPGLGSIIVWEWAPDGSQRHVLEYPLILLSED